MLTPKGWTRHTNSTFSAPVPSERDRSGEYPAACQPEPEEEPALQKAADAPKALSASSAPQF